MKIVSADHHALLAEASPVDLLKWHEDFGDIDWQATLSQPNWHLITDQQGSFCLIEPRWLPWSPDNENHFEAHLIIAPEYRGKTGLEIARQMLDWIDKNTSVVVLDAKTTERKTRLFLRWLGFRPVQGQEGLMRWKPVPR